MCLHTISGLVNAFPLKTIVYKRIYRVTEIKEPPLANSHIRDMLEKILDFFPVLLFCLFYPTSFQVKNFTLWICVTKLKFSNHH